MTTLSSPLLRAPAQAASDLAGGLLALAFGAVALRHGERPCHRGGVTYTALVTSRGTGTGGSLALARWNRICDQHRRGPLVTEDQ